MAGETEARGVTSLFDGSASNTTTIQSQPCLLQVMLCCLGYLHRQRFFVIGKATTCTPNCKSNGGGWGGWWVCKGQGFDTGDPRTNRIYRRQGGFEWLMTLGHTCLFTLSGVAMAKQHGGLKKKKCKTYNCVLQTGDFIRSRNHLNSWKTSACGIFKIASKDYNVQQYVQHAKMHSAVRLATVLYMYTGEGSTRPIIFISPSCHTQILIYSKGIWGE